MAKSSHRRAAKKPQSRFVSAVAQTPDIAQAYQSGLQAIAGPDKKKIRCRYPRRLQGSVCVDQALQRSKPNDPRWDYAIGYAPAGASEQIIWVEVHPASSKSDLDQVCKKLLWLRNWLDTQAPKMNYKPRRIIWVATGSSSFSDNHPDLRALRSRGLEFVGNCLVF